MTDKYFMHRIQEENGAFTKGIEVHDDLDSAIRAFWGRMKTAYNNQAMPFAHCKITDVNGNVVSHYDMACQNGETGENKFFVHSIRENGETVTKGIDAYDSYDEARSAYATAMEYGYNNPKFANVTYVSCEITDKSGAVMTPYSETWIKPEEEPEEE